MKTRASLNSISQVQVVLGGLGRALHSTGSINAREFLYTFRVYANELSPTLAARQNLRLTGHIGFYFRRGLVSLKNSALKFLRGHQRLTNILKLL